MANPDVCTKIYKTKKKNYLIITLKEAITDTEFKKLKSNILQWCLEDSVSGVVLDLKSLDVIDSFATRILINLAHSAAYLEVPMILAGVQSDVVKVMERQGLVIPSKLVQRVADVSEGVSCLEEIQSHNH
jgi:rsbT antagonist protein RsbS